MFKGPPHQIKFAQKWFGSRGLGGDIIKRTLIHLVFYVPPLGYLFNKPLTIIIHPISMLLL
jgi:hypothetical protein